MGDVCLIVKIDLSESSETDFSLSTLTNNIVLGLKNLFGEGGAAIPLQVESFDRKTRHIRILTYQPFISKLRCALTLLGRYQGVSCCFSTQEIEKISD